MVNRYKQVWANCSLYLQGRRAIIGTCETSCYVASSWPAEFNTAVCLLQESVSEWSVDPQLYPLLQDLISTQWQARKLISGHVKTTLLSFNRTQSRVVTGLPAKIHLLIGADQYSLIWEVCGRGEKLSPRSVWLWSLGFTQTYLFGLLFLGPRRCQKSKSAGSMELQKWNRVPLTWHLIMRREGPV